MKEYSKDQTKREYITKEERSALERALRDWLKGQYITNYLLAGVGMILLGIFIRMILSN